MPSRPSWLQIQVVFALGILGCAWGVHRLNVGLESLKQEVVSRGEVGPLPDGDTLRVLSLGFERLIADLYWIRTLFYIGSEEAHDANYPSTEGLANLVTDIDPEFHSAYVLLSSVLGGLRYDPEAAIRLLEKGAQHSDYWRIHFLLGFYYFMELGDYERGALALSEASKLGGPPYLPMLAARLYAQGGRADAAIAFVKERLREEKHPRIVNDLKRRLRDLLIHRDLEALNAAIGRYRELHGAAPTHMAQLVDKGVLKGVPRDPAGREYVIRDGKAESLTDYEEMSVKQ